MGSGGTTPEAPALLELRGIRHHFGGVQALRGVDLTIRPGQVHALLGENGAGKSTLMNVLSGVLSGYQGRIVLDGRTVRFPTPAAAQRAGVSTVHQELDLVPGLTIADNLVLGHEPVNRMGLLRRSSMLRPGRLGGAARPGTNDRVAVALDRVGLRRPAHTPVRGLRLGERQLAMIAKALYLEARILVLDEPTAALTTREVDGLFETMDQLRLQGVAMIFISHRLEEVPRIADIVTIMRDGLVVAETSPHTPPARISQLLTGRTGADLFPAKRPQGPADEEPPDGRSRDGDVRLCLEAFGYLPRRARPGWTAPRRVDLHVRQGEIVGLVGLLGAGRSELLEVLTGAAPPGRAHGRVELDGRGLRLGDVRAAHRQGIGYVPEDRRGSGFVQQLSVAANLTMATLDRFSRGGFVQPRKVREAAEWAFEQFGIVASSTQARILSLSGGNQQKVVIGRALLRRPGLLLLDEPTRGVDVGAKADIYALIRSLTRDGLAVLVASSELPELVGLCDRLVVLAEGVVVGEFPAAEASVPAVLAALDRTREVSA